MAWPGHKTGMTKPTLPKQDRGHERRNKILDAAARLLIEEGDAAASMQAVAAQAGASTGSMYHFFRNRQDLLDGLYDRHNQALLGLLPTHPLDDPGPWRAMPVPDLIESLFGRPLAYLAAYPDAIVVLNSGRDLSFPEFAGMVSTVLSHRMEKAQADAVAAMLVTVSTGTMQYLHKNRGLGLQPLIGRIPAVLSAYLTACEAGSAADRTTPGERR